MKSLTEQKALERIVSKLIARSWIDNSFQKRFFSAPSATLREAGLKLEEFVEVEVIEKLSQPVLRLAGAEGGTVSYEIPLPAKPAELSDELLKGSIGKDSALGTGMLLFSGNASS